ncbi:MAG: histidine--tRNA ligase [Pseudanabaenaceae cyanobacterium]
MSDRVNYSLPSGFNIEFLPGEKRLEQKVIITLQTIFEKYGFTPIETPAVERLEVLQAKGNQGDNILYSIAPLTKETDHEIEESRALKFDQTVPLAAYIARHLHEITFPFARYQMDMVFRGERAKTGRYRQFRQCDIDVVGRKELSLLYDAQIPAIINEIFTELDIGKFVIRINNRKILTGFFRGLGISPDQIKECIKVVDTLEKVGTDSVKRQLYNLGVNDPKQVINFISTQGDTKTVFSQLVSLSTDDTFQLGIKELETVTKAVGDLGVPNSNYTIDLSIARGLDYYTGTVYETTLVGYESLGSICSGGRYEDLVGMFAGEKLPGVGISIGLTRLLKKLLEIGKLQPLSPSPAQVMILNLQSDLMPIYLELAQKLRSQGIKVLTNFEARPFKKQLEYANKLQIPYCIIIGSNEKEQGICRLKNMQTGAQNDIPLPDVLQLADMIKHSCN